MIWAILLSALLPGILASVQYRNSEREQNNLKDQIASLNTANYNLSEQIESLSKKNDNSQRKAEQAQLELKELQLKNTDNLVALYNASQENLILVKENTNYITGREAIPLIYTTLKYYDFLMPQRGNDPKLVELQDKWVLEFLVENSSQYLLTDIKTDRITTGGYRTRQDDKFSTIVLLGPKDKKELQPPVIFSNASDVDITFIVKVEWKKHKYDLTTRLLKDEIIDPANNS